jgi:hypothetical protein
MPERTDQPEPEPTPEPDLTPQPNQILATPDTVEACKQEYAAGADVRGRLGWKDGQA